MILNKSNTKKCRCWERGFLKDRFNRDGCRLTAPRKAIIEFMHARTGHFSAEEVLEGVKGKNPNASLATVYRTLNLLSGSGIIRRLDFGEGKARYELSENHAGIDHHHHLVCVSCGKIVEYRDFIKEETELLGKVEKSLSKKHGFAIKGHIIQFNGICPECSE